MTFHPKYFIATIILFLIEVGIAVYIKDDFIRPYLGDFLVVILLYTALKSVSNLSVTTAALIVLCFSFLIEFLQYLNLVTFLGLQNSKIATTILGSSFSWYDMLAYTLGIGFVFLIEKKLGKGKRK
ncbi:MAG TPA: DUF2809 domain-containing protein [Salinimicrobium sp.]|nr:DUF2809 domain-containing protein [Salinimicrobium sp.]